ncbi:hypothetical protein HJC23_004551 [Cyclotella cryptica]|uniref:Uncharacterized protein n=1 Tax=Cyclotella cryptica TaxID=29204 RepID=A0ABD3QA36_9STRA
MILPQSSIRPLPRSLWLLLPLLLSRANAQSVQGFVYWDSDFNGILSEGVLDRYGTVVRELENGVVNVRIEVRQCGSIDGESIIQGLTGWLSNYVEVPGNSNIHAKAGYYKIDVSSNVNTKGRDRLLQKGRTGCLITKEEVGAINSGNSLGDDGATNSVGDAGCYLVVSSPKDYEITTTFPIPHSYGFYGWSNASSEETNSIVDDIFNWIPYKDIGPFTTDGGNEDTRINRGYQTRTTECFGFNKDNGEWYAWKDESLAFGDERNEAEENDGDFEVKGSGAVEIAMPNSRLYGYDRYLTQTSYNLDDVLSISPVGMSKALWPLPLRVKSDVYLGLKFNDNGPLEGRFQFQPTSENEALAASKWRPQSNLNREPSSPNIFSADTVHAENESLLDNIDGILADVSNFEDVVKSFLRDEVLYASGDGSLERMLTSLDIAVLEQWSMVKISDSEASLNETRHLRILSATTIPDIVLPPCRLRGSNINNHRILRSMPTPQTVFYLQVYGTYEIRTTSEIAPIIQTIKAFGKLVSSTINRKRDDLLRNIRTRTGIDGPECYRPTSSINDTDDDTESLSSYNAISIGLGSPNAFACEDLLPLYYSHLSEMVAREDVGHTANSGENVQLSKALEALKEEDAFYGSNRIQGEKSSSAPSSLIPITLSIFLFLLVAAAGTGWVIYERRRRATIRKRKRILKERRAMEKSSKKNAGINPIDNSHKSKADARASSSDDDIELGRRFDDSRKTSRENSDLEQSILSGLDHHVSRESGLNHFDSSILVDHRTFKTSQAEICEVASTENDDTKNMTRIIEKSSINYANAFSRKSLGKAFLSFQKSTTRIMLGEVDISDSEDITSDSDRGRMDGKKLAESLASPIATVPLALSPTPNRKMFTSALINAHSSLTRPRKPPLDRNVERDQTGTRSRTTQSKTLASGVEASGLISLSVPNADSSNSSDNHSFSSESFDELSPAPTFNVCTSARESDIAMSEDQHFSLDTFTMQRSSQPVDSNSDDSRSSTSINISSDSHYSSSESSSEVILWNKKNDKDCNGKSIKNRHQNYNQKEKASDRPTARMGHNASETDLIVLDAAPTTVNETLSSNSMAESISHKDSYLRYEPDTKRDLRHFLIDSEMKHPSCDMESSDYDSSNNSSNKSSGSSSSESSSGVIVLKKTDVNDSEPKFNKKRHQNYRQERGEVSDRPTAKRSTKASGRHLINGDPASTAHKERLSSGVVKGSKSRSDRHLHYEKRLERLHSDDYPKERVRSKIPSLQKHKTERRISLPEPRGVDYHVRLHPHAISEPCLVPGRDVALVESMHRLSSGTKAERHKHGLLNTKSKSHLRKSIPNRQQVEQKARKKIEHPSKYHSHSNTRHDHLGDSKLRKASAKVPRGQTFDKKLQMARVETSNDNAPKSNDSVIEAHTDKQNRHESQLHESILTKTADYLPRGLESAGTKRVKKHEPSRSWTNSSKSKSGSDLDYSSNMRISLQSNCSTRKSSRPRDSRKVSDVTSGEKRRSAKPDPPAQSELQKHNTRKVAIEKLNSLKSSLKSSLKGTKLSEAATSILECADGTDNDAYKDEKKLKGRSKKSSHSARASELSSSNPRETSSSRKLSRDIRYNSKR